MIDVKSYLSIYLLIFELTYILRDPLFLRVVLQMCYIVK